MIRDLTNREREVLQFVVENFIRSALPVGSRSISKGTALNLSSATIRNVMSDLEDMDLLHTPHTSAGRIPTDKAYRYYVDILMSDLHLNDKEKKLLENQILEQKHRILENEDIYIETTKILGKISHQLAIITKPFLDNAVFEKLEIVSLSSTKILVVISISSGYAKTVLVELEAEVQASKLDKLSQFLNERLQGLTLKEIRQSFDERVDDYKHEEPDLLKVFVNYKDEIYGSSDTGAVYISGTGEIINQPEFDDPKNFKNIINLAEDKQLVVQIFKDASHNEDSLIISIGEENPDSKLKDYSVLRTTYNINDMKGNIGIIGPKRMDYAKMVSLLKYTSDLINRIKF